MTEQEEVILWQHDCPGVLETELVTLEDGQQAIQVTCYEADSTVPRTIEAAITANAYIVEEAPVAQNLVKDPTFAGDGSTWRGYTDAGAPVFDILTVFGRLDDFCARIRGQSLEDKGRWFTGRDLPVSEGVAYALEGWMLGDFTEGEPNISVTFWDTDLNYSGLTVTAEPVLTTLDTDWVKAGAGDIMPPAGAVFARVELRVRSGITGEVHFDDIYFGPQADPVPQPTVGEILMDEADARQVIQFNPQAALQRVIFEHGFVPNSSEFDMEIEKVMYRAQRAEHLGTGEVRVYYAVHDKWDAVYYYTRP